MSASALEKDVVIPVDGAEMRAHLAAPAPGRDRPGPAVIVIHDIFGFSADVVRITNRLAANGYAALAPRLYDSGERRPLCVVRTIRDYRNQQGPAFERLERARQWLAQRPDVDESRIGVMGFCLGGGFAVVFAVSAPVAVVAPFYGHVPPTLEATRGICPVVGGWGEQDPQFAPEGHRLVEHLEALGVEHDVAFYPNAGHGFMNRPEGERGVVRLLARLGPGKIGYDAVAAEDSWARVLAFFKRHLEPPSQ